MTKLNKKSKYPTTKKYSPELVERFLTECEYLLMEYAINPNIWVNCYSVTDVQQYLFEYEYFIPNSWEETDANVVYDAVEEFGMLITEKAIDIMDYKTEGTYEDFKESVRQAMQEFPEQKGKLDDFYESTKMKNENREEIKVLINNYKKKDKK